MHSNGPAIQKVKLVHGKNIDLREVDEQDAEFILTLRLDARRNRFLSPVHADVEKQRQWIRRYSTTDGEAYFIVCTKDGQSVGTVRIYDASGESFSWGSWILKEGAPASAAIESAALVYSLATKHWGFRAAHFQVHPDNVSVLNFHEKFGARRVAETSSGIELSIDLPHIECSLKRFSKYLPTQLRVE